MYRGCELKKERFLLAHSDYGQETTFYLRVALDHTKKCSLPVQRVAIIILAGWEAVPFFFCIEMMWNVLKDNLENMKKMYPVGNYIKHRGENNKGPVGHV